MEYAEQYIALCLGGAGSASAPAPGIVLDGTEPFTLDMMVRGIPVESAASVLHQEGALDVRLTAKGFSFWREGFGIFSTSSDGETFQQGEWNHLCIVYELGTVRLFVNGSLDRVVQKPCKGSACSKPFVVGTGVKGGVRQLRLFDRAFGGMEVQDLLLMDFADIRASSYAGSLVAFYDFGCKAPVERVSGSTIALQGDAKMRALFPSVQLRGSAYLAISNEPGINPAGRRNDAYSIQAWIRLEPFDGQDAYTVFANGDLSEEAGMSLYVARDEASWRLCALRDDEEPMISKGLVQPQLWTNVCLTYDGLQTQSLYVDGVLDSQISTCLPISDVLEEPKLRIGADLSNGSDNGKDCF
ncbi:MAG: LamG-like jellyroll fold domain-containing protein, partial [Eggerthella sp.]|nr:LamG-like jellyroll fold domain-containing protein [Eggerthella sp.]